MNRRVAIVAVLTLTLASGAWAGMIFTSTTTAEGGKGAEAQASKVKGWTDGDRAKVEFLSSGNPIMPAGSYLISKDGGKAVFLVNPKEKTFSKFDMEGMMQMAGGAMKMMNMKFSDPVVEKLGEEPNGLVANLPTIHYRYRTSYSMSMSFMGMKSSSKVVREEEIWSAPKLVEMALGIWLRKAPPKFGDPSLDNLVKAEMEKIQGFPLKRTTVQTSTNEKGKTEVTRTTMEVTSLEMAVVPASTFEIPAGYTETDLLGGMGGEGKDGENPFAKMMGGKK